MSFIHNINFYWFILWSHHLDCFKFWYDGKGSRSVWRFCCLGNNNMPSLNNLLTSVVYFHRRNCIYLFLLFFFQLNVSKSNPGITGIPVLPLLPKPSTHIYEPSPIYQVCNYFVFDFNLKGLHRQTRAFVLYYMLVFFGLFICVVFIYRNRSCS